MIGSRALRTVLCLIAAAAGSAQPAAAQGPNDAVNRAIEEAKRTNPGLAVKVDPVSGLPRSIKGIAGLPSPGASPGTPQRELTPDEVRQAVTNFFERQSASRGLGASLFPAGHKDAREEVVRVRKDPDIPGQWVAFVEQKIGNVRVFGSSAKVVVGPAAAIVDLSASMSTTDVESVTPAVTREEAIAISQAKLQELIAAHPQGPGRGLPWPRLTEAQTTAELVVFDPVLTAPQGASPTPGGKPRLAWTVMIDAVRFFVDAKDKSVLHYFRDQPSARTRRVFDLEERTAFPGQLVLEETSGADVPVPHPDVRLAFDNAARVYDFFRKSFDRDSFDDNGRPNNPGGGAIESFVRYGNLRNAQWCSQRGSGCPRANVMVYGTGYAAALDIVGHEFAHGVIAFEADLVYSGESGAVNEAFADIFGTLIENAAGGGNWLIGERLPDRSAERPLRNMANPTMGRFNRSQPYDEATNNGQPDHFADVLTARDRLCGSLLFADNGCVHLNSGIINKLAHLIAEGGQHRGATITGIGRDKLARLAYRALTLKLNRSSGFVATGNAFTESCDDLAPGGVAGFSAADCAAVRAAVNAVGLAAGS